MSAVVELAAASKGTLSLLAMMAAQGTLLALIAAVIARGRMRPAWQAAVWLIVLAKFVLPWGPAMPWSLADLFASLRGESTGAALALVPRAAVAHVAPVALGPVLAWLALGALWASGVAAVLGRALVAHARTVGTARRAIAAPAAARELLARLAPRIRARLAVGDPATGPYVVGTLRPIIVVPPALLADETLLRAALLHELAHVRRRDALGRAIQLAALAVFWWFPVVRFASRRLELARERACDAWALEAGDVPRPAYARLLVRMAELRLAAAPSLGGSNLDARVDAVLGPPARPRLGLVHRIALAGFAMLALGGARTASAQRGGEVCVYTPELAEAMMQVHPAADSDGDGVVSREEACDFQAALRKRAAEPQLISTLDDASSELLAEPLCCNCDAPIGLSSPLTSSSDASCQKEEGVDR